MSARTKKSNPWIFFICSSIAIVVSTLGTIYFFRESIPSRIGLVLIGSPTVVVSYDQSRKTLFAVSIPSDVQVDMVRGYGTYPISSLWTLDVLDKRRGVVLTESFEEVIGFPVRYFIHAPNKNNEPQDIHERINASLTYSVLIQSLFQKNKTNIPFIPLFELIQTYRGMSTTDMKFIDLSEENVFVRMTLPDGNVIKKIDGEKIAFLFGTYTEDAEIRKENFRLAVYNSTTTAGLAQKITRILEKLGFHVSVIANDDSSKPSYCVVKSKKDIQNSVSVKTLRWLYRCVFEEETQTTQTDISLIIGTEYEKRFLPF